MTKAAQIVVPPGAAATRLDVSEADAHYGNTLILTNKGTVDVILGGDTVTAANGWRGLVVGSTITLDAGDTDGIYALVAGATPGAVDVLKVK